MSSTVTRWTRAAVVAVLALGMVGCGSSSQQSASGYRFELVETQVRPSPDAEFRVRLVHLPENRPVSGATIFEHRFEMLMSSYKVVTSLMVEGANPPTVLSVDEGNGVYRVHAQLPMAGDWQATLVARVPGEPLPVRGSMTIRAR